MDQGDDVDLVFMGFTKAFDAVNNNLIMLRLQTYGTHKEQIDLIKSFLFGRFSPE